MKHHQLSEVAAWAGLTIDGRQEADLRRLEAWLVDEAADAGGIGPREAPLAWERHILDSLMFAQPLLSSTATDAVDIGTGIGLPGLPLAVALPDIQWRLVDRSGRRIRLLRRAIRLLGLQNAEALERSADRYLAERGPAPALVMRGVLPPPELPAFVERMVAPGGVAVIGGGLAPDSVPGAELLRFPGSEILAPGRWLRIMRRP